MRNYASLLPRVLAALFPGEPERARAAEILSAYGAEPFHTEQARVHLGILRLAGADLKRLVRETELACMDYRDLLVAAEYPRTGRHVSLMDADPAKYREMAKTEAREYDDWVARTLGEGSA